MCLGLMDLYLNLGTEDYKLNVLEQLPRLEFAFWPLLNGRN